MSDRNPIARMLGELQTDLATYRVPGARAPLPQDIKRWEGELDRIEQALASVLGSSKGDRIGMFSGVSARTGQGFVSLTWGNERGQLSVDETRQHALALLEAAEAAQYDSVFLAWMLANQIAPPDKAGLLLLEFRRYREQQAGAAYQQEQPIAPPEEEGAP